MIAGFDSFISLLGDFANLAFVDFAPLGFVYAPAKLTYPRIP